MVYRQEKWLTGYVSAVPQDATKLLFAEPPIAVGIVSTIGLKIVRYDGPVVATIGDMPTNNGFP